MMCYKDRTFCINKNCKEFLKCSRALTPEVQADAERWWGSPDAPIVVSHFNCEEEQDDKRVSGQSHDESGS